MKICPNCQTNLDDNTDYCVNCGLDLRGVPGNNGNQFDQQQQQYYQQQYQQAVPEYDHTAEFDAGDVAENKIFAMFAHLSGFFGIIVALLACRNSGFVKFHIKQSLKIEVATILVTIISLLLCWTFIVPIAGLVFLGIFFVLKIILFFQAGAGVAKEPAILRGIKFLK